MYTEMLTVHLIYSFLYTINFKTTWVLSNSTSAHMLILYMQWETSFIQDKCETHCSRTEADVKLNVTKDLYHAGECRITQTKIKIMVLCTSWRLKKFSSRRKFNFVLEFQIIEERRRRCKQCPGISWGWQRCTPLDLWYTACFPSTSVCQMPGTI